MTSQPDGVAVGNRSRSREAKPCEYGRKKAGDNYQVLRAVAIGFRVALRVFRLRCGSLSPRASPVAATMASSPFVI